MKPGTTNIGEEIDKIAETAGYLCDRGWAECNAGNISVRIGKPENLDFGRGIELPAASYDLPGQCLLMTSAGSRMRDVARNPKRWLNALEISGGRVNYATFDGDVKPSSEAPTHLALHTYLAAERPEKRALIHSHATELIALSHIPGMNARVASDLLFSMHAETIIFLPRGVGYVPYALPGTRRIAEATLAEARRSELIIWESHGCLAYSEDCLTAFDLMDCAAKSAKIFFLANSVCDKPQGLNSLQLSELKEKYLKEI
ncbi:MAG: rhamnulose-1-phosphate aldolase [Chloroflexota bacterium]